MLKGWFISTIFLILRSYLKWSTYSNEKETGLILLSSSWFYLIFENVIQIIVVFSTVKIYYKSVSYCKYLSPLLLKEITRPQDNNFIQKSRTAF